MNKIIDTTIIKATKGYLFKITNLFEKKTPNILVRLLKSTSIYFVKVIEHFS